MRPADTLREIARRIVAFVMCNDTLSETARQFLWRLNNKLELLADEADLVH